MHAVISAVWSVIRLSASNLLPQRNYLITFELTTLRTNFLITNHIDVDCRVVTKAGRSYFLPYCLRDYRSHITSEREWSTVSLAGVRSLRSVNRCRNTQDMFFGSSKAHFLQAITTFTSTVPATAHLPAPETSRKQKRPAKTHPCPHVNCPQVYKQLSGLRYHLSHVSRPYLGYKTPSANIPTSRATPINPQYNWISCLRLLPAR